MQMKNTLGAHFFWHSISSLKILLIQCLLFMAILWSTAATAGPQLGLETRPSNVTCVAAERPTRETTLQAERVFQNAGLGRVLFMAQPPGNGTRWYAAERGGGIRTFANNPATTQSELALDLSDRLRFTSRIQTEDSEQWGVVSIAFHPGFPTEPFLYVGYNAKLSDTLPVHSIVSRFTLKSDGRTFDPASERILLSVPQRIGNALHHLGHIAFGPDGYLYISIGDGAQFRADVSQNPRNLFGKVLRIDVDTGTPYGIPAGNPFANGVAGAPEVFALGLRNPWRFSFDRLTGELWLGDVGNSFLEEVNRVVAGGNYGWALKEGTACFPSISTDCLSVTGLTDPEYEFGHDVGVAVIGGYVYRGLAIPDLRGAYLFSAVRQSRIWSLTRSAQGYDRRTAAILPDRIDADSFAESNNGDLFVISFNDSSIFKIVPDTSVPPPGAGPMVAVNLSETGCVDPARPERPAPGAIPYDLASPLWSDGTEKSRWMGLPDGTTVRIGGDGDFTFPVGTVFAKMFSIGGRPIETRLFMRHADGAWGGYSYEWLDDASDARLLEDGKFKTIAIPGGGTLRWHFPSRDNCFECHNQASGFVLGPETLQLNSLYTYAASGIRANQLATWAHVGLFESALPNAVAQMQALPLPTDPSQSTISRARSYLHANCSYCHRPNGIGRTRVDFRFQTRIANMNVCNEPQLQPLPDAGDVKILDPGHAADSALFLRMSTREPEQMPPLATSVVDTAGTGLIRNWIRRADVCATSGDGDGDGTPDSADNCVVVANPDQRDSNRDGIGDRCDGDFNGDRKVDNVDLRIMGAALDTAQGNGGFRRDRDLDGDFDIDLNDYRLLKRLYGKPPGPSCCG
jgi:uncharacterized repeat protein (TIGR03806 family)